MIAGFCSVPKVGTCHGCTGARSFESKDCHRSSRNGIEKLPCGHHLRPPDVIVKIAYLCHFGLARAAIRKWREIGRSAQ
jgi:hypothetical protein